MTQVTILLDPAVTFFYMQVAQQSGYPLEKVLSDTLYKIAGELSVKALIANQEDKQVYDYVQAEASGDALDPILVFPH